MGIFTSGSMKYFTVAVMTAINLLNYVDRYTIAGKYFPSSLYAVLLE
jgi:hypothetical protein